MRIIIATTKKMIVGTDSFGYRFHEELSAEDHFVFLKDAEGASQMRDFI